MERILIDVYLPLNNKTYDFYIPLSMKVEDVITKISHQIMQIEKNPYLIDLDSVVICSKNHQKRLNKKERIGNESIVNGTQLILV